MAFISRLDEDDETAHPGGAGGATTGAVASTAGAPVQGSKFVNFGRYLAANRDAAARTGAGIVGDVEAKGAAADKALGASQSEFQKNLDSQPGETTVTMRDAGDGRLIEDMTQGPAITATSTFSGPGSLSETQGWGDVQKNAQQAGDMADATGTEAGVGALVKQKATGPYSQGMNDFDAALVGAASGDQFAQVRAKYGGMSQRLNAANDASVQQAGDVKARVQAGAAVEQKKIDDANTAAEAKRQDEQWFTDVFKDPDFQSYLTSLQKRPFGGKPPSHYDAKLAEKYGADWYVRATQNPSLAGMVKQYGGKV